MSDTDRLNHSRLTTPPPRHHALEGIIVAGSYDPISGTVSVLVGDTGADDYDGQNGPLVEPGIPLMSSAIGDQQGPIGDERCILIQRWSGYAALIEHGENDSPKVPAGERWIAPPGTNASLKFQKNKETLTASEIDLIAASVAKIMTQQMNVTASDSTTFTTPSFSISSGTIFCTAGGGVRFVGNGSDDAEPVLRVPDLVAVMEWWATHTHHGVQGGGDTSGPPAVAPPAITGSPNFSIG